MAILTYNGLDDPYHGFDFGEEIPKQNRELYGIKARGVHLMNPEVN